MLSFLSSWVKMILSIYIFATLVEIVLPTNKFKKYVRFVLGFIILITIIMPIFKFLGNNVNVENTVASYYEKYSIDNGNKTNLNEYNKQLIFEFKNNLVKRIEEDIKNKLNLEYIVKEIKIDENMSSLSFGKVYSLTLVKNYKSNVKPVEKVVIGRTNGDDVETVKVKKYLSEFLKISQDEITVIK
ncbi:MAG: stage III sporulation protein AF [Caloramator sp.]|nr:stage III sporulation protein AF [Caloramator sp.]